MIDHGVIDTDALRAEFRRLYGSGAVAMIRAPGRVNLIGEHIDYCGLSVLPAALERAVWVAYRSTGRDEVRLSSVVGGFEPVTFRIADAIPPAPTGDWGNYPRAAFQAMVEAGQVARESGFDALVASTLPVAAGLSSSSALVVATALAAFDGGDDEPLDHDGKLALADLLAAGERYVGTAGGGMDQAACLLGVAGHAVRIDFDPLGVTPVAIPEGWAFVVAHSGESAEKSGAAQAIYNRRTAEAAEAIRWGLDRLGEARTGREPGLRDGRRLAETPDALARLSAMSRRALPEVFPRLRHILSEAARVSAAERALRRDDLSAFGAALSESHQSLRRDYEVSTPRLDAMVDAAVDAGAAGARLTGAGLGGCMLAVCRTDRVERVLAALAAGAPFVARFADGASVIRP